MKAHTALAAILVAFLVGGCTGAGHSPAPGAAVPLEDKLVAAKGVIARYFKALSNHDFPTAYGLMSEPMRSEVQTSNLSKDHLETVKITDLELQAVGSGPVNRATFRVSLDVKVSGPSSWQPGKNVRYVVLSGRIGNSG